VEFEEESADENSQYLCNHHRQLKNKRISNDNNIIGFRNETVM
jgi:hypothetical protein